MKIRAIILFFSLFGSTVGLASYSLSRVQSPSESTIADLEVESGASKNESLVIWWQQAYVSGGSNAIARLVREWEKSSGIQTTLQLTPESSDDQLENAIARDNSPDIAFMHENSRITARLAWEGKLADVSDIIQPIRDSFKPSVLERATYLNKTINRRSFYGIPIGEMKTFNIHYWKPYLDRLGLKASDIPQDWQGFWSFWQDARDRLHQLGETNIASFCITLNKESNDGPEAVLQFLHGHNANIFDNEGKLVLDRPENRQGLIDALSQLSDLYRGGYIPPRAMEWTNADNNYHFLDRQCLLVTNPTLSIPTTQNQPDTPYTQTARNRYLNEIVTVSHWPNTVNGNPFKIFVGQSYIIIPANSKQLATAKQFLAYVGKPENLQLLNEQEMGQLLPHFPDRRDPHLEAVQIISASKNIQPYPSILNPAYAEISKERIFTTALEQILREGVSPEEAADGAIARIQEIID
ncbi:MAG: ABC transporter substrate-binding protein [Cyanobacteria bacterium P01_E01_bin.42]